MSYELVYHPKFDIFLYNVQIKIVKLPDVMYCLTEFHSNFFKKRRFR